MADRCILKEKAIVTKIWNETHLPANTIDDTDSHYVCSKCLRSHNPINDL